MSLTNAKIFLCAALTLTLYQHVLSMTATDITNITHFTKYNDNANDNHPRIKKDDTKIVGGSYATNGQFPFMAVVHKLLSGGSVSQCGGSIISSRWVLTAGHCLDKQPVEYLVVFGIIDKTGIMYNSYTGPGVAMITRQAYQHPQYKVTVSDIGLLYMPQNIPFSNTIQPIHLAGAAYTEPYLTGKTVAVVGWGRDSMSGGGTKRLKYASLPIISSTECKKSWSISQQHICTAASKRGEACQGDSGGPLVVVENGVPIQVGIVSYGDGLCPSSRPGVFTRVSSFVPWIKTYEMVMYMWPIMMFQ